MDRQCPHLSCTKVLAMHHVQVPQAASGPPACIDSRHRACCVQGPPYKPSLKVLAERFLKRPIQQGSHDSIDDAKAAMDLALLKTSHGPSYGTSEPICCSSHTCIAREQTT